MEAVGESAAVGDINAYLVVLFTDDSIGMSDTPDELQRHIEGAMRFSRKRRLLVKVKMCAVTNFYNESKVQPVEFTRKWANEELPRVGYHRICFGIEFSKD